MVILAELVAYDTDPMGYTLYVFRCLDSEIKKYCPYCMCTRYPNWNHKSIKLGDIGYLHYEEVFAGKDSWFDGNKMIPYKYNAVQFIRFIEKPQSQSYVM